MRTQSQHRIKAEDLLDEAERLYEVGRLPAADRLVQRAQVHATLAGIPDGSDERWMGPG